MIVRPSSHRLSPLVAIGALLSCCAPWWLPACSGDDDDSKWAPRHGNGSAPEGAQAPSHDDEGTAGSGSGSGGSGGSELDTSNVPDFDPGAVGDRQLDSLTDDELEALCERAKSYFVGTVSLDEYERMRCFDLEGAGSAETVGECLDLVDSCLTTTSFDYLDCSLSALHGDDETCSATIDDYAGCIEEHLSYTKAAVDFFDCKRSPDQPMPAQLTAYPAACDKLASKCSPLD
jgi:hypothetical protein